MKCVAMRVETFAYTAACVILDGTILLDQSSTLWRWGLKGQRLNQTGLEQQEEVFQGHCYLCSPFRQNSRMFPVPSFEQSNSVEHKRSGRLCYQSTTSFMTIKQSRIEEVVTTLLTCQPRLNHNIAYNCILLSATS